MKRIVTLLIAVVVVNMSGYCQRFNKPVPLFQFRDIDSLLDYIKTAKEDPDYVRALNYIAWDYNDCKEYEKAIQYAFKSMALAAKVGYGYGIGDAYYRIGHVYRDLSNYSKALEYFQKALTIHEQFRNKQGVARQLENIGAVYNILSDYPKALEYQQKALNAWEQLAKNYYQNDNENFYNAVATNSRYIGKIYCNLSNYSSALEYYQKALTIYEKYSDKFGIANTLGDIGLVYICLSDYHKALEYEQQAMTVYEQIGLDVYGVNWNVAFIFSNLGMVFLNLSDYAKALEYYQKALMIKEKIKEKNGVALLYNNIGAVYQKQKNLNKAKEYEAKGLALALEIGSKDLIRDAYRNLTITDSALNNFKGAYENHKLYMFYNDSIFNIEKEKNMTALQMKFEFDKIQDSTKAVHEKADALNAEIISKQKFRKNTFMVGFILVLILSGVLFRMFRNKRKANVILTEKSELISEMLVEKDLLMKEIHHRVKNNLQIISGLLELQWVRTTDENTKAVLSDSQHRVMSMSFIHQNLYQNDNRKGVEMRAFVNELANHINMVFEKKSCAVMMENNFESIFLDMDTAIPMGLIINELLTNSFKYAFEGKENGSIKLELRKTTEGNYFFSYFDNGKGLPKEINLDKVNSLGLKLVSLLSRQIGGTIKYQYAGGSYYQLEFKDQETRNNTK